MMSGCQEVGGCCESIRAWLRNTAILVRVCKNRYQLVRVRVSEDIFKTGWYRGRSNESSLLHEDVTGATFFTYSFVNENNDQE